MAFPNFDQFTASKFVTMEPFLAFNGITTRMCSELARENIKMMNELMQCGVEQLQGLSHARGVEEVMAIQSKTFAKATPQVMEHAQHVLDTMLQGATEYSKLFEKGMQTASNTQEKVLREIKDKSK